MQYRLTRGSVSPKLVEAVTRETAHVGSRGSAPRGQDKERSGPPQCDVSMKRTVYVETSVVSYFTARPSRDVVVAGHQESTRDFWVRLSSDFQAYVSALVYQESGRGDPEEAQKRLEAIAPFSMLDIDDEARALAEQIIAAKAIPEEYPEDALHVAVAAVNGIDVLVTWNFAHLNNPSTGRRVRQIVEELDYACPEICSPDQLLEAEQ